MLRAAKESVCLRFEVFDADPLVGREDAGAEDLDVGVIAGVVLGHHGAQPRVVAFVGGFPGLSLAQLGISLGHLVETPEDEVELDRHRLLAPQGAVVVEHGDALFR